MHGDVAVAAKSGERGGGEEERRREMERRRDWVRLEY